MREPDTPDVSGLVLGPDDFILMWELRSKITNKRSEHEDYEHWKIAVKSTATESSHKDWLKRKCKEFEFTGESTQTTPDGKMVSGPLDPKYPFWIDFDPYLVRLEALIACLNFRFPSCDHLNRPGEDGEVRSDSQWLADLDKYDALEYKYEKVVGDTYKALEERVDQKLKKEGKSFAHMKDLMSKRPNIKDDVRNLEIQAIIEMVKERDVEMGEM
ncbi:hypothetical protein EDC01DRAFT_680807 [Geopyxis carbonaria]|nr:hypothetical protein EDC01DRAFT_680807 [Geopyxis carbonaria]